MLIVKSRAHYHADRIKLTSLSFGKFMRIPIKLIVVVSCASIVGALFGVAPSFISRTMAQDQVKAQAKPAAKAKKERVLTDQFRWAGEGIGTISPGGGVLVIDCGARLGRPSNEDERRTYYLSVVNADHILFHLEKLQDVVVPAGMKSTTFHYSRLLSLPPGRYRVGFFMGRPNDVYDPTVDRQLQGFMEMALSIVDVR
jgi:hypothetical protein